jgi:uncharacterized protein
MRAGEAVLLRTIVTGRVREALPLTFVAQEGDRLALYCAPGTPRMRPTTSIRDDTLASYEDGWDHFADVWRDNHVLWLVRPTDPYALLLFWNGDWEFLGWYLNLQDPLRRVPLGFDTREHFLDVVIDPDGSWQWKDEDELERAVELGLFTPHDASAARAAGERVLAERPWPTGWEDWRPDPQWPPPSLPQGWDTP